MKASLRRLAAHLQGPATTTVRRRRRTRATTRDIVLIPRGPDSGSDTVVPEAEAASGGLMARFVAAAEAAILQTYDAAPEDLEPETTSPQALMRRSTAGSLRHVLHHVQEDQQ